MEITHSPAKLGDAAARAELIQTLGKVARGDRAALQQVYSRTSAKLFGVCLRILPDRSDAEDALQDAFVTIWQKAASFDASRASPITWLVTLTRNRAIDRLRARKTFAAQSLDLAAEIADDGVPADKQIEQGQDAARLAACLDELKDGDSVLIRAAFLQGATYPQLATRAALPLATVKSRIRRALIKLRGCLTG
jgi:RNA polymerase sigma-70 factor (ECF subfamily)